MKIIIHDDMNMIIFLNKIYLENINFEDKEELENYFQKLLKNLKKYYNININGYYEINVYIDKYYGVILELKKEELEYLGYFEGEVDMQLIIHDTSFLYKIDDYFWIDSSLLKKIKLYKYNKELYIKVINNIDVVKFGKIIENSKINYKHDLDLITNEKNLLVI